EPQTRWRPQRSPAPMRTSPTLKTLLSGQEAGIAKTSPRRASRGSATASLLRKPGPPAASPAVARASGDAGMTPPLAAIARRFSPAPSATSGTPGTPPSPAREPPPPGRKGGNRQERPPPVGQPGQVPPEDRQPEGGVDRPQPPQVKVGQGTEPATGQRHGHGAKRDHGHQEHRPHPRGTAAPTGQPGMCSVRSSWRSSASRASYQMR